MSLISLTKNITTHHKAACTVAFGHHEMPAKTFSFQFHVCAWLTTAIVAAKRHARAMAMTVMLPTHMLGVSCLKFTCRKEASVGTLRDRLCRSSFRM